jgi:hypothetical protein
MSETWILTYNPFSELSALYMFFVYIYIFHVISHNTLAE